ncbi:MAG: hypothetical protein Q7S51_04045 [Gallionellaceae bacterium]|nr:hypothetical protein [Gallionellaceae bacterium]
MGYAELLKTVLSLPKEKQSEVFDFVTFLAGRCGVATDSAHDEWTEAEFAEFSMRQAVRGMENDPVRYTLNDLKEHWQ